MRQLWLLVSAGLAGWALADPVALRLGLAAVLDRLVAAAVLWLPSVLGVVASLAASIFRHTAARSCQLVVLRLQSVAAFGGSALDWVAGLAASAERGLVALAVAPC